MNTLNPPSFSKRIGSVLRTWMNNSNSLTKKKSAWFGLCAALLLAASGTFVMIQQKYPQIELTKEERLKLLDQQAQPFYDQAKGNVSSAVRSIRFKTLCWKLARDKLTDSTLMQEYLQQKLTPVIAPCKEMAKVYGVEADSSVFQKCMQEVGTDAAVSSMCAVSGLAFEAVFIRATLASLMKVCGASLARITAALGTGAACAVADGPFPLGDALGVLIAVGGTAWSCYDLYHCSAQMPLQMNAALNSMIDQFREACRKAAVP